MDVKDVIARHIAPMEIVGDISEHDGKWRAMVAVTPSGPLVLMEFTIKEVPDDKNSTTGWPRSTRSK